MPVEVGKPAEHESAHPYSQTHPATHVHSQAHTNTQIHTAHNTLASAQARMRTHAQMHAYHITATEQDHTRHTAVRHNFPAQGSPLWPPFSCACGDIIFGCWSGVLFPLKAAVARPVLYGGAHAALHRHGCPRCRGGRGLRRHRCGPAGPPHVRPAQCPTLAPMCPVEGGVGRTCPFPPAEGPMAGSDPSTAIRRMACSGIHAVLQHDHRGRERRGLWPVPALWLVFSDPQSDCNRSFSRLEHRPLCFPCICLQTGNEQVLNGSDR